MNDPEYTLKTKDQLLAIGTKTLGDLYDAATSDEAKLDLQRHWYQALHKFSANVMMLVIDDAFDLGRCPSDMERCNDGSCMPPGQC
jgi:hypothetical protein